MVNVKVTGIGERLTRIQVEPLPRQDAATPRVQRSRNQTLQDQNLLARVLTIAISVDPIAVEPPIVSGGGFSW